MGSPMVITLTLLLLLVCPSLEQGSCLPASTVLISVCSNVINETWYSPDPATYNITIALEQLAQLTTVFNGLRALAPKTCYSAFVSFYCTTVHPKCNSIAPSTFLPSAICYSSCAIYRAACPTAVLQAVGAAVGVPGFDLLFSPDCNSTETSNPYVLGQPRYPATAQIWNLGNSTDPIPVSVACIPTLTVAASAMNVTCYDPWKKTDPEQASVCQLPCPLRVFRTSTQNGLVILWSTCGVIGLVLCTMVLISMISVPNFRHFPANLSPGLMAFCWVAALGFSLNAFSGRWHPVCYNEWRASASRNGLCLVQAVTLMVGALGMNYYWLAIAVNTWQMTWFNQRPKIPFIAWVLHGIAAGIPIILGIVGLAANGFGNDGLLCVHKLDNSGHNPWGLTILIIPNLVASLVGGVCIALTFVKFKVLHFNIRMWLFLLWQVVTMYMAIINDVLYNTGKLRRRAIRDFTAYAECTLTSSNPKQECHEGFRPNAGFYVFLFICNAGGPICASLLLGTANILVKFWQFVGAYVVALVTCSKKPSWHSYIPDTRGYNDTTSSFASRDDVGTAGTTASGVSAQNSMSSLRSEASAVDE